MQWQKNHWMIMKTEVLEKIQEDQKKRHPERYQEQEKNKKTTEKKSAV